MKGLILSMGIGAAVGAVAVMMLPQQSAARKLANKAAGAVEQAVQEVGEKLTQKIDM